MLHPVQTNIDVGQVKAGVAGTPAPIITQSYKRTFPDNNIRNVQFGVIQLFDEALKNKDDPKYKNMTAEMEKTVRLAHISYSVWFYSFGLA